MPEGEDINSKDKKEAKLGDAVVIPNPGSSAVSEADTNKTEQIIEKKDTNHTTTDSKKEVEKKEPEGANEEELALMSTDSSTIKTVVGSANISNQKIPNKNSKKSSKTPPPTGSTDDASNKNGDSNKSSSNNLTKPTELQDTSVSEPKPKGEARKMKRANTTGSMPTSTSSSPIVNSKKVAFNRSQSDITKGYVGTTTTHHGGSQQGQGIDAHPYARGSVIEVLYGVACKGIQKSVMGEDDEDDEDDDSEEGESDNEDGQMIQEKNKASASPSPTPTSTGASGNGATERDIRLADIIDRAPSRIPDHANPCYRWKYYIHYREYNRRMDEWVSDPTRIISPPSIGNAKNRALKKEKAQAARLEEERKRKLRERGTERLQEKRRRTTDGALSGEDSDGNVSARPVSQRASSRRARDAIAASSSNNQSSSTATTGDTLDGSGGIGADFATVAGTGSNLEAEQERLRSRRRRKSSRSSGTASGIDGDSDMTGAAADGHKNTSVSGIATVVTTLLPENEIIQDKVVTVAAQELDEHEGLDEAALREHEEVTKVKNVKEVELGRYKMDTWYYSPLPKDLLRGKSMIDVLYICEFTLKFFTRRVDFARFQKKYLPNNKRRHPPGNEIYRNGNLSMFEVDGFEERIYCQQLCYLAKLFLDHKTLYYDVDPFLFYVLCEVDDRGFHPVGYYSKEKYSDVGYNLACILTFPCHQRKGYGRLLIDFSYELSKKEEKVGSPEKPMSDLGQQAYKPYWTSTIVDFLLRQSDEKSMSIMDISKRSSIMAEDIIFTLNMLGLLKYINGVYFITAERTLLKELAKKHPVKEPRVDPARLHWTPYMTDV
eukprot:CAMPEP_0194115806 /NCGR_PEP_ID=MMETSP0150-20130528/24670_1 /TAXON_ID=122233 /ORGANISM="Chaetoceros debilis, Strain MM31A-1" /LENGTH=831 /DNA_ID=CAMNT_0038806373 /DNA_START=387 /DNA_END=2879 /DNA_ORIENTATION=-